MDETFRADWLDALADDLGGFLWTADPDFTRLRHVGPGFERVWGRAPEEACASAEAFFAAVDPEDRHRVEAHYRSRPDVPWDLRYRVSQPDGTTRWVRDRGRPLLGDDGTVEGYAGMVIDNTTEAERNASHERYREELAAVFRALPDLVLVLDSEGRYLRVASGDARQLYRPETELVGRRLHEVLPPETAERFLNRIHTALSTGEKVSFRYPLEIEGRLEWFDAIVVPITAERVLWVARTITERMELERQLAHASKLDALGQLAGGIAHDFNNAITVIRGTTTLVADAVEDDEVQADLADIRAAAERASSLTRQLLAFSRQQVLKPQRVVVAEVLEQMGRMLSRIIGEHIDLEISTENDARWPVLIDAGQLEQVVVNLVLNARYAIAGGGTIRVQLATARIEPGDELVETGALKPGDHVSLTVADDGRGMAPDVLERVFEPFFTTKPAGEGSGLGLSMVYGTVRQSGGHIDIRSEPDAGTRVRILLPRARDRAGVETPGPAESAGLATSATVLVVEDEEPVRQVVRRFLEGAGHTVVTAEHGEQAVDLVQTRPELEVVISDLIMPRMGGVELMRRLRAVRPDLPVIFMSGYTGTDLRGRDEILEAEAFLTKPFGRRELLRTVGAVVERAAEAKG